MFWAGTTYLPTFSSKQELSCFHFAGLATARPPSATTAVLKISASVLHSARSTKTRQNHPQKPCASFWNSRIRDSPCVPTRTFSPPGSPPLRADGFVSPTSIAVTAGQLGNRCVDVLRNSRYRVGRRYGSLCKSAGSSEQKQGANASFSSTRASHQNRLRQTRYDRGNFRSGDVRNRRAHQRFRMMTGPPGFEGGPLQGDGGNEEGQQEGQQEAAVEFERHKRAVHRVIFMRHGESEWNRDNRFLGWADIGLTNTGETEARRAAKTLTDFGVEIDEIFCSYLKRSIKSAWILADELDQAWLPIHTDWRLNEQMYGALQGLNKRATAERFGTKLTQQWRRSYDIAPPAKPGGVGYFPPGDPKYAALTEDDIPASWCGSPNTESLKDAQARSWLFWRERAAPAIKEGKTILICGHGNIIRSMLKRLDNIPKSVLKQVSIPRATPLVYDLDEDLIPVSSPSSIGPLRGRFLCNPLALARALQQESLSAQLGPVNGDGSVGHEDLSIGDIEGAVENGAILPVPSPLSVEGSTEDQTAAMLP